MDKEEIIEKTEEFMIESFEEQDIPSVVAEGMIRHLLQTRDYLLQLTAGSQRDTTALEIAALLHGIERAFRRGSKYKRLLKGKSHEERSMIISNRFMKKKKFPKSLIKKVDSLIEKHEVAPTKESKILRDADNLSFLENTLPIWFEARLWMGEDRKEIIKDCEEKIDEKFKQIDSDRAKILAKRFMRKWSDWLDQKKPDYEKPDYKKKDKK